MQDEINLMLERDGRAIIMALLFLYCGIKKLDDCHYSGTPLRQMVWDRHILYIIARCSLWRKYA